MATLQSAQKTTLQSAQKTLKDLEDKGADPRVVGLWKSRVTKLLGKNSPDEENHYDDSDRMAEIGEIGDTGLNCAYNKEGQYRLELGRTESYTQIDGTTAIPPTVVIADTRPTTTATIQPRIELPGVRSDGTPIQCLCGCGKGTHKGRRFVQGHDAKFKSTLIKIEKGQMTQDQMPAGAAMYLTSKCRCCGVPLLEGDIGPVCATGQCKCKKSKPL